MNTIIDVTVECGCQEEIELVGAIIRKTLPNNPVLVHDENVIVKALNPPPNEMLLAKYWAAKEMADSAYWDARELDGNYWRGNWYFTHEKFVNILAQILKKEWCR
jgi:hypothetical protein